jgi:hypothetical protein
LDTSTVQNESLEFHTTPLDSISRKDVNYKILKKKKEFNYIPVRFFLDISLEFTLIPFELGKFFNLTRSPGFVDF